MTTSPPINLWITVLSGVWIVLITAGVAFGPVTRKFRVGVVILLFGLLIIYFSLNWYMCVPVCYGF
jgi:antibiotic biosynthesis monooxygenase (ABM) superfamily enzyme